MVKIFESFCLVRVVAGTTVVFAAACGGDGPDGSDGSANDGSGSDGGGTVNGDVTVSPNAEGWKSDFGEQRIEVETNGNDCSASVDDLAASGAAQVEIDGSVLYAGWEQTSGNNQDPVVSLVQDGEIKWCRHHEDDGPDSRAMGVTWDGGQYAYVVYSTVGGGSDLEGKGGWLESYAPGAISGGGAKVSVVGRVDVTTGELVNSTFVIAVKMDGRVNSHAPTSGLSVLEDGSVEFHGESAHKPVGVDRKVSMTCTDYPFDTTYRFSADLSEIVCAESTNCSANMIACE